MPLNKDSGNHPITVFAEKKKHLNINVLIDFSDRISSKDSIKMPSQKDRDIAIINVLCQAFKNNVDAFKAFKAEAKMSVFFHPAPNDPRVADIARKLNVQCKKGNSPEAAKYNKSIYRSLGEDFSTALNEIYEMAIQAESYPGSRIFGFMKDEVSRYVEDTSKYRNILVILTDGYVYHKSEKYREGEHRYSYIERDVDHFRRFRNRDFLKQEFDAQDYGLINTGTYLNNMEVLVLELSPPSEYPVDYDILRKYWSKWLGEMGVRRFEILGTNQPVYTQREIDRFLSRYGGK